MNIFLKLAVVKVKGEQSDIVDESIITEYPLKLYVNDEEFNTFYCTPKDLKELAVGYLIGTGVISGKQDIVNIEIIEKMNLAKMHITQQMTSIKKELLEKPMAIQIQTIYQIMGKNVKPSELFLETGGFHNVAIYDGDQEVITIMDVARHNAVDKVIGYCVLNNIDCSDKILVVSGRISSDMISKAEKANIPVVLSKSAPTSLSIARADEAGITLVGFVRGERMNVYTHPERIDLSEELFRALVKKKRTSYLINSFQYLRP